MKKLLLFGLPILVACVTPVFTSAQSFQVQCPLKTALHPGNGSDQGAIKCQQLSVADGYATMGDGTQTYLFAFGPLSGLGAIASGQPGTLPASAFMTPYDPAAAPDGVVGLTPDLDLVNDPTLDPICASAPAPSYCPTGLNGHVDARQIMDVGVLNGNIPAPMMAIDEDDEFFLTLSNVGMIMRPDLFEQHTVHFHGYPNASSFYDGVPDASVAINIGGSFTYYYLAPDAGTYFWHCHITPPEHLQMGMVGQLYVRPRQNRASSGSALLDVWTAQQSDARTRSDCVNDILCPSPKPLIDTSFHQGDVVNGHTYTKYAYNDGDGSTRYDVEYPIQIH